MEEYLSPKQQYQGKEPLFVLLWTAGLNHAVKNGGELTVSRAAQRVSESLVVGKEGSAE